MASRSECDSLRDAKIYEVGCKVLATLIFCETPSSAAIIYVLVILMNAATNKGGVWGVGVGRLHNSCQAVISMCWLGGGGVTVT